MKRRAFLLLLMLAAAAPLVGQTHDDHDDEENELLASFASFASLLFLLLLFFSLLAPSPGAAASPFSCWCLGPWLLLSLP